MMGIKGNFLGSLMNPYMLNTYFYQPKQFVSSQNAIPFIGNMQ